MIQKPECHMPLTIRDTVIDYLSLCISICSEHFTNVLFCTPQNLNRFSLRENKIKELPQGIGKLEKLLIFDISYNHLEHLPDGKTGCKFVSI